MELTSAKRERNGDTKESAYITTSSLPLVALVRRKEREKERGVSKMRGKDVISKKKKGNIAALLLIFFVVFHAKKWGGNGVREGEKKQPFSRFSSSQTTEDFFFSFTLPRFRSLC